MDKLEVVLSVSEFVEVVNQHLALLDEVVVEGEISELHIRQNKWVYTVLKDEEAIVQVFGSVYQLKNLKMLTEGMQVRVWGRPRLYPKYGKFSISAREIVPVGQGSLKLAYEKLKRELEKEGLFEIERKRPLPSFPERIGLVTAKHSQAYNDFIKVLRERMGGLKIKFYPVSVQGSEAVKTIIQALNYFNNKEEVDVVVITRGGGSLEDLAAFNDERIVRAVFASKVPTLVAIGHEGNVSLAELAADLRASTPSNAAELLVRQRDEVIKEIQHNLDKIFQILKLKINSKAYEISKAILIINRQVSQVVNEGKKLLEITKQKVEEKLQQVVLTLEKVGEMEKRILLLNPKNLLRKGYLLAKNKNNKLIKSIHDIQKGEQIITIFYDGRALVAVNKISEGGLND